MNPDDQTLMSEPEIITFGCRLNAYESEVIREQLSDLDLQGAVIVNTCAVTGEAVRQAKQRIRKSRRENPHAKIIVTGCAAQIEPKSFAEMSEVDHVIGNQEKLQRETYVSLSKDAFEPICVNDIMSVRETALHMIAAFSSRTRAYVQIQNGCDHRCTFCIIPFGRGNSRSVPAGDVVTQIRTLVERGTREVVLTGVDITSYGGDLPGSMSLGLLVQKILLLVPDLERLRLSSIDSIEVDPDLIDAISSDQRLMPHLHLSLQSGDNMILKRMKRRHLREDSIRFCEEIRARRPDIVFGADLIAGFPTESDEMFAESLSLIEACNLTYLHVFPFSPRPETPAARMPQLPRPLIKERAKELRTTGRARLDAYLQAQKGRTVSLLMERSTLGRTPHFSEMQITDEAAPGTIVEAFVTGHQPGERLEGHQAR